MRSAPIAKTCEICGDLFNTAMDKAKYCSDPCRAKANKRNYCPIHRAIDLSTGTVGAMHEYLVAYDLMRLGYVVFKAMSPACFCDLLIQTNDLWARIEVRTGYVNVNGKLHYPSSPKDVNRQDGYAIVDGSGRIHYLQVTDQFPSSLTGVISDFSVPTHSFKDTSMI